MNIQKPPVGVGLRKDGHWSVDGLTSAFVFNEAGTRFINHVDKVSCGITVRGAGTIQSTPDGILGNGVDVNTSCIKLSGNYVNGAGTMFAVVLFNDPTITDGCVFGSSTTNRRYLMLSSSKTFRAQIGNIQIYDGVTRFNNTAYPIAVTWNSDCSSCNMYVMGKKNAATATATANMSTPTSFNIGSYSEGAGNGFQGLIYCAYTYNRTLSPQEVKSLSENPYQMFATQGIQPYLQRNPISMTRRGK